MAPVPLDSTINVMLLSTGVCFGVMGLLIGVLCGSMTYALIGFGVGWLIAASMVPISVSYTHLTLPTICSV